MAKECTVREVFGDPFDVSAIFYDVMMIDDDDTVDDNRTDVIGW